jgi:hypothetical protein
MSPTKEGWNTMTTRNNITIALLLAAAIPAAASAQSGQDHSTGAEVGRIAVRPAQDIGVVKTKVPALLAQIVDNPYSMSGTRSCASITNAVRALDDVLGPDFGDDTPAHGNRKGAMAKAGGKALVDSIIPFRGLVREVTGAASAERRVQLATFAGVARRGFLHGIFRARGCRGAL